MIARFKVFTDVFTDVTSSRIFLNNMRVVEFLTELGPDQVISVTASRGDIMDLERVTVWYWEEAEG